MEFEWNEEKRLANLEKHGIDFIDIPEVFDGDIVTVEDDRYSYGEQRFITFGLLQGRVIAVVHTDQVSLSGLFLQERRLNMNNEFISQKSQNDWQRLDAMNDEDIDLSDCPEVTPEQFAKAVVRRRTPTVKNKEQVTVRIDNDVLEWFKSQGQGYQTQINTLLREYMESHKSK